MQWRWQFAYLRLVVRRNCHLLLKLGSIKIFSRWDKAGSMRLLVVTRAPVVGNGGGGDCSWQFRSRRILSMADRSHVPTLFCVWSFFTLFLAASSERRGVMHVWQWMWRWQRSCQFWSCKGSWGRSAAAICLGTCLYMCVHVHIRRDMKMSAATKAAGKVGVSGARGRSSSEGREKESTK
jgi:hypothetical protein